MKYHPRKIAIALSVLMVLALATLVVGCGDDSSRRQPPYRRWEETSLPWILRQVERTAGGVRSAVHPRRY